jgi:hypothetical protein
MSVATLKKKSKTLYKNLSVGVGFSINGTRRNLGYIGRSAVGLHYPRTLMRGNEPRGYGGCCGTYKRTPIVLDSICNPSNNGNTSNNNPKIIKKSVLDANGRIMTKWIRNMTQTKCISKPNPYLTVKPDSNMIQGTQQSYIEKLSKQTVACLNATNSAVSYCKPFANTCGGLTKSQRPRPFNCVIRIPRGWYSVTKNPGGLPSGVSNKLGPTTQGAFIQALGGSCKIHDLPFKSGIQHGPLPGPGASN